MEEKILQYFNSNLNYTSLKVLDNKYRKYYTGVTLNYIVYDLLKAKYKKSDVSKCLLELHKNNKLKSLFCPDVKQYVFRSDRTSINFDRKTGEDYNTYTTGYNLHNYLKQFIKNE